MFDYKTFKLLRTFYHSKADCLTPKALTPEHDWLIKKGYITSVALDEWGNDPFDVWRIKGYAITVDGRVAYRAHVFLNYKFWLPLIISVIALIKSFMPELTLLVASLLKLLVQ